MSTNTNTNATSPRPFALVRELREMDDARRAATAANNVYKAYKSRAAATIEAAGEWTTDRQGRAVQVARIGKTATLTKRVTVSVSEGFDEYTAREGIAKARAAREALERVEAAEVVDVLDDLGEATREELEEALTAYRDAAASALRRLRALPSETALNVTVERPRTTYTIEL